MLAKLRQQIKLLKVIWEMIRKIASKQPTIPIKHLSKDNSIITDKKNYNRPVSRNFL